MTQWIAYEDVGKVLAAIWLALSCCAILTVCVPGLQSISLHGKQQAKVQLHSAQCFLDRFNQYLQVPKRYFTHMYAFGLVVLAGMLLRTLSGHAASHFPSVAPNQVLVFVLWTVHLIRRLLECCFITKYNDSSMHVGGYAVGLVHYFLVPLSFVTATPSSSPLASICATLLYIFASLLQFHTHVTLYAIKRRNEHGNTYCLPTSLPYKYISTPHYFAEIMLYLSFLLLLPHYICGCLFVWVVVNLGVVADQQYQWYRRKYPEEIPKKWYRLIPFVW